MVPTKAELKALISAYAKKLRAQKQQPSLKIQQRIHDAWQAKLNGLVRKYPVIFPNGFISEEFLDQMEALAEKENSNKIMTGSGCDW